MASEAENHEFEFFRFLFEQNISVGLPPDDSFGVSGSIDVIGDDGFRSFSRGNSRRQRRRTSIKFPVAPQSTRAVISTVCVPLDSLMGIRMVLSLGRAVITWFTIWEEYVDSSFQAKNPQVLRMLCSLGDLHSIVSGFGELWLCLSLASSRFERMLQWQRLGEWDWCWAGA